MVVLDTKEREGKNKKMYFKKDIEGTWKAASHISEKHHILSLCPRRTGGVGRAVGRKQSRTREREFEKDSGRWKKKTELKKDRNTPLVVAYEQLVP